MLDIDEELSYIKEEVSNRFYKGDVVKMDEKHRQYCIRLGNPYMQDEKYNKINLDRINEPWIPVENNNVDNWTNNSKKFTN